MAESSEDAIVAAPISLDGPVDTEKSSFSRDMSSVSCTVIAANRLKKMGRYRAAADLAIRMASISGDRQKRLQTALDGAQALYTDAPEAEWEDVEMMIMATFQASSTPKTSHALLRDNLHKHLGQNGINRRNINSAVKHTAKIARDLQIPEAESPEIIRGVVNEVVDQTVENNDTELTEEEGQFLKDVLEDAVNVVLDLIKGEDPDYEELLENVRQPGFLSLLRKGIVHLFKCRCCCRPDTDDDDAEEKADNVSYV